jgi:sugar lactone lactonase YvrE
VTQTISSVQPNWVVPGARVLVSGVHLPLPADGPPHVLIGTDDAYVVAASADRLRVIVPPGAAGGTMPLRIDELPGETAYLEVARVLATGVHMVDSPAFGADGRLYVTQSGDRATKPPVPLYRIAADGSREPITIELGNPTSLALGPDGELYVSSRFEGHVYRLGPDDRAEVFATELGVPTGLACSADGRLFVGDRSGSIFSVTPDRQVETFATLPASIAAFHLAFGPDGCLYVTAPTLSTHDAVYRITPERIVDVVYDGFGRPQGLAFDSSGDLYVAEALAGSAGLYRLDVSGEGAAPELVVAAPTLVGVAFDPEGGLILGSNDTVWRLDNDLRPLARAS